MRTVLQRQPWLRASALGGLATALILVAVLVFGNTRAGAGTATDRLLTAEDMAAVFGDAPEPAPTPCKKSLKCNAPFKEEGTTAHVPKSVVRAQISGVLNTMTTKFGT